ncbi:MAG: hypothetical protein AAF433_15065 [Bacteroidota bacterium]
MELQTITNLKQLRLVREQLKRENQTALRGLNEQLTQRNLQAVRQTVLQPKLLLPIVAGIGGLLWLRQKPNEADEQLAASSDSSSGLLAAGVRIAESYSKEHKIDWAVTLPVVWKVVNKWLEKSGEKKVQVTSEPDNPSPTDLRSNTSTKQDRSRATLTKVNDTTAAALAGI